MYGQKGILVAFLLFTYVPISFATSDPGGELNEFHDFVIRPAKNPTPPSVTPPPSMTAPSLSDLTPPRERLSLGVNYTGGQVRWSFSQKWSMEVRAQFGNASSDYGDVKARVFGVRGYRFLKRGHRFCFYAGPELAYASAEAQNSSYRTSGVAFGAFGGLHLPFASRFSLDTDLGPYVISLKEQQTGISSTNLDFVLNSALVVRIF